MLVQRKVVLFLYNWNSDLLDIVLIFGGVRFVINDN